MAVAQEVNLADSSSDLNVWIEKLFAFKYLTEHEIKLLCEKVRLLCRLFASGFLKRCRRRKSSWRSRTYSR